MDSYTNNHPSYVPGRSAPNTPGILSRNSSRKQLQGWGLSRKDASTDTPPQPTIGTNISFALPTTTDENNPGRRSPSTSAFIDEFRPKSKSEIGLQVVFADSRSRNSDSKQFSRSGTTTPSAARGLRVSSSTSRPKPPTRAKTSTSLHGEDDPHENWLTHATSYTTALLNEGKPQTWSRHASTIDLKSYYTTNATTNTTTTDPLAPNPLSSTYTNNNDEYYYHTTTTTTTQPPSPAQPQTWGSRFGSRPTSRTTTRRNSRAGLITPMTPRIPHHNPALHSPTMTARQQQQQYHRAATPGTGGAGAGLPDFVDVEAQREVERSLRGFLASQRVGREGWGFGDGERDSDEGQDGGGGEEEEEEEEEQKQEEEEEEDGVEEEEEMKNLVAEKGRMGVLGAGIIERIVGLGASGREEDEEGLTRGQGDVGKAGRSAALDDGVVEQKNVRGRRRTMPDLQRTIISRQYSDGTSDVGRGPVNEGDGSEDAAQGGGGWKDMAWLLSVASKVLL